jgi:hypothetical protein
MFACGWRGCLAMLANVRLWSAILLLGVGTILLPCLASGAFAQAVEQRLPGSEGVVRVAEFRFPARLSRLKRSKVVDFRTPGMGQSVRYVSSDGTSWSDVYIYDREKDLTRGSPSHHAMRELMNASEDLNAVARLGHYRSVKQVGQVSSRLFESARFEIDAKDRRMVSYLFVGVHRGKFVKVRLSALLGTDHAKLATDFMMELVAALGLNEKPI